MVTSSGGSMATKEEDRDQVAPGTPAPPGPSAEPARAAGVVTRLRQASRSWLVFALPAILLVAIFFVVPFLLNMRFAFSSWTAFSSEITWNGLDNFRTLIDQELLVNAVRVTVLYAVCAMVIQNVVSLSLALTLQTSNRINTFYRSVFFLPVLISPLAAGYIWRGILDPDGPANAFLSLVLPGTVDWAWLGEPRTALVVVAFVDAWKWSGLITLVYIAGLNAIPRELIDSARVDGAGAWARFWQVKFPLLAPAVTFNVAVTLVGALSAFDVVAATTAGGPGDHTRVLNIAMQQQWGQGFFGTASALNFTVTLLVVITAVPLVWWLRRREVTT